MPYCYHLSSQLYPRIPQILFGLSIPSQRSLFITDSLRRSLTMSNTVSGTFVTFVDSQLKLSASHVMMLVHHLSVHWHFSRLRSLAMRRSALRRCPHSVMSS